MHCHASVGLNMYKGEKVAMCLISGLVENDSRDASTDMMGRKYWYCKTAIVALH